MFSLDAKYYKGDVVCAWGQYRNGAPALRLLCANTGNQVAAPSTTIRGFKSDDSIVYIKDYSENIGTLDSLVKNGVLARNKKKPYGSENTPVYQCLILDRCK